MVTLLLPSFELSQESLRFLLRRAASNDRLRHSPLAIKLVVFGIVAGTACPQIIAELDLTEASPGGPMNDNEGALADIIIAQLVTILLLALILWRIW